jgi:hypothetical protein
MATLSYRDKERPQYCCFSQWPSMRSRRAVHHAGEANEALACPFERPSRRMLPYNGSPATGGGVRISGGRIVRTYALAGENLSSRDPGGQLNLGISQAYRGGERTWGVRLRSLERGNFLDSSSLQRGDGQDVSHRTRCCCSDRHYYRHYYGGHWPERPNPRNCGLR